MSVRPPSIVHRADSHERLGQGVSNEDSAARQPELPALGPEKSFGFKLRDFFVPRRDELARDTEIRPERKGDPLADSRRLIQQFGEAFRALAR